MDASSPSPRRQGGRSVRDYAVEFRTLAAQSDWNRAVLVDMFLNGLCERVLDQMILLDFLEEVVTIVARIDRRQQEQRSRQLQQPGSSRSGRRESTPPPLSGQRPSTVASEFLSREEPT